VARIVLVVIFFGVMTFGAASAASAADVERARQFLSDAHRYMEKRDWPSALIQIRNALQQDPKNAQANFDAGQVETLLGHLDPAERGFRAAAANGYDQAKVDAGLAEVLVRREKFGEVLDDIEAGDRPPDLETRVRNARGYAYFGLRRTRDAARSFQDAIRLDEKNAAALAGLARIDAVERKYAEAQELLERAVQVDPTLSDTWLLLGYIRLWQGDTAGASNPFNRALQLAPNSEPALRAHALVTFDRDRAAGQADVAKLLGQNPNHKIANYLNAIAQAENGRFDDAENSLQNIQDVNQFPPGLLLLARIHFNQRKFEHAEEDLKLFLALRPNDRQALALRAAVLMRRNDVTTALPILERLAADDDADREVLSLLADAYSASNNKVKAAEVLQRIAKLPKQDADAQVRLAMQEMRIGQWSEAAASLQAARGENSAPAGSTSLLIANYLAAKEYDKAWKVAVAARDAAPNSADAQVLLGLVALRRDGPEAARSYFEKAIDFDPNQATASIDLASIYRLEGKPEQAREVLSRAFKQAPTNLDVIVARADLERAQRATSEEIAWLERARPAAPQATPPRFRLVALYLATNQPEKAVAVATELRQIASDDPQSLAVLGQAQIATREFESAIVTFQKLAALTIEAPTAMIQLSRAQLFAKDRKGAAATLQKAITKNPNDANLQNAVTEFATRNKQVVPFIAFMRELSIKRPDDPGVDVLTARLLLADGRTADALEAYTAAAGKDSSSRVMLEKAQTQASLGKQDEAIATLRDFLQRVPGDRPGRTFLAQRLAATGKYDEAIAEDEKLVAEVPGNAFLLNDLAWYYAAKGDKRALATAQEAHRLAPDAATIDDTLGWILLQSGDAEGGLKLLKEATSEPTFTTPGMKYRLAVAYDRLGRSPEARKALEDAFSSGTAFAEADDAKALRAKLGN
jgi:putative PEP-CTERM system TPR-repeat lipoprotein